MSADSGRITLLMRYLDRADQSAHGRTSFPIEPALQKRPWARQRGGTDKQPSWSQTTQHGHAQRERMAFLGKSDPVGGVSRCRSRRFVC